MTIEAAYIFRDILLGLEFLHENSWLHLDIKPQNIGVLPGNPPRAVILDIGQATFLRGTLKAKAGRGGTVNYLAPEREICEYDHAVDVWSVAVIGFELIYGYHPFRFAVNPWRPGKEYESLRPVFAKNYSKAISMLSTDFHNYTNIRYSNFIHSRYVG